MGGFRLVRQLIDAVASDDTLPLAPMLRKYRGFISGVLASALGLTVDDHFLGSLLVIWWSLRALRALLPVVPHAPTAIMCAAAAVLNPAAFLFQDEHQPAYQRFMEKMSLHVKRDSLLGKVVPGKSLHGWDQLVFCDEVRSEIARRVCAAPLTRNMGHADSTRFGRPPYWQLHALRADVCGAARAAH